MDEKNKKGFLASNLSADEMRAPQVDSLHVRDFRTPEQVAADESDENGMLIGHHDPNHDKEPTKSFKDKVRDYYYSHKKLCIISAVLIISIFGATGFALFKPDNQEVVATPVKTAKPAPKITTVPSTLTGIQVEPEINSRTVTAVMIENSMEARPQSGLGQVGIVFEAIAEGGITRFMALFQDTTSESVGPVRSARPYYVEWASGFDAGYAHVGGSPEALANIREWGIRDLDQFFNSGAYHRTNTKQAPHNVYTSLGKLDELEVQKGYVGSTYTGFIRNLKEAPLKVPTAKSIDLNISSAKYNVHYDYNPATNSYNRVMGGAPHVEANTNAQISPRVVIALVTPFSIHSDGKHSVYGVVGSGQAYIFQDGGVTLVNWTKPDRLTQITFTDSAGLPFKLTPGQTWITAVKSATSVTSTP